MAVVLAIRLAIALTPVAYRIVASSQPSNLFLIDQALRAFRARLDDPAEDPAQLTEDLNAAGAESDPLFSVTDFTGTFELRKLQWRLSRAPGGGTLEDVAVMTFHFIKASGGTPGTYVDGTDLPAVETALNAYWTSLKVAYPSWLHSDQFRWYKDGPAFYELNAGGTAYVPIGDNAAIRVTEVDVAGTLTTGTILPPQTALTVTEKTSSRRHWGRWYLPAMGQAQGTFDGRVLSASLTAFLGYAVTFYNSCRSASMIPVVWSIQKPARPGAGGTTLPAAVAKAYEVTSLQMDDLWDVIRSRRYDVATLKPSTTLT